MSRHRDFSDTGRGIEPNNFVQLSEVLSRRGDSRSLTRLMGIHIDWLFAWG